MVRTLAFVLAIAPALLAAEPRPKAEAVMPKSSDLPHGYRHPWELSVSNAAYKTEAAWREENPNPLDAARQAAKVLEAMSQEDWTNLCAHVRRIESLSPALINAAGSTVQRALFAAVARSKTQQEAARHLELAITNITDGAFMEFARFENLAAAAQAQVTAGENEPDAGGVERLSVTLLIMRDEYIRDKASEVDLDAAELTDAVKNFRGSFDTLMRLLVSNACRDLEEDLVALYTAEQPDREAARKTMAKMNAYAGMRVEIKGLRPGFGDSAHHIAMWREPLLDMPATAQGYGQMRKGVAVVQFEYRAASTYARDYEKRLDAVLEVFFRRLGPFETQRSLRRSPAQRLLAHRRALADITRLREAVRAKHGRP